MQISLKPAQTVMKRFTPSARGHFNPKRTILSIILYIFGTIG